ncbi:MAG TPA: dienelactone hydrolase family protein [Candidatus Aquilonibacter sp.]
MIAVTAVLIIAVAAGAAFMAYSLLELPVPSGPFAVGTVSFTLQRPIEPGERSPGQFTVQLWYPALASGKRALYGTGVGGRGAWLYHRLVRTHSAAGAIPFVRRSPVIIYVPAWGGQRTENTALAEDLASHGYAVAAIDDVTRDSPVLDRLAGSIDVRSDEAYSLTLELARRRLAYETQRASSVLDYLTHLDAGDPRNPFTGRFDLRRVGILGYSFGGAVALEACRYDHRFSAAMNLDGILWGAGDGYRGGIPYFLVSDANPLPTSADLASDDPVVRYTAKLIFADDSGQRAALRHGGYELTISDTVHASFSDVPLYAPLQRFGAGWSNPPRITTALRQYTLAFFDSALDGKPSPLLTPGTRGRPAMTLTVGTTGLQP